jgi:hypothetical protein
MTLIPCIYCRIPFDPKNGEGDHALPSAIFGEFKGDVRFRGCCRTCNNKIGRLEQIIAGATPLGYLRQQVRPQLRRRRQKYPTQIGAMGSKAPKYMARNGKFVHLVRSTQTTGKVSPCDSITIYGDDGEHCCIELYPSMNAQHLRTRLHQAGVQTAETVYCNCEEKHTQHYRTILANVFSGYAWQELADTECGEYQIRGQIKFEFSTDAYRALAKMAFHYYLTRSRRGYTGREPEFQDVRHYIMEGGDADKFFGRHGPEFQMPFGGDCVPAKWCHVLSAYEERDQIVVNMRLYAGPDFEGENYTVKLGDLSSNIIVPSGTWGHVYEYDISRDGRYSGAVQDASIARLR